MAATITFAFFMVKLPTSVVIPTTGTHAARGRAIPQWPSAKNDSIYRAGKAKPIGQKTLLQSVSGFTTIFTSFPE
jgi:hypothetical protein